MGESLRKAGKLYSKIIMRNIGIFVFIGILEVVFGPSGWLPYENIYAISLFTRRIILPSLLSYGIAGALSEHEGGITAALAVTGILAADLDIGLPGALLAGTFCGLCWKRFMMPFKGKVKEGLEMLTGNLTVAVLGLLAALFHYFAAAPVLIGLMAVVRSGVDTLIQKNLLPLLALVIEPAKVVFLNNSINYGVVVPLGMQQAEQAGSSVLFLLEANPGPGFGLLMALLLLERERRREYKIGAFVQMIGGIHEIYFPMVLERPVLLIPLIAGGASGMLCFELLGAGLAAPAAPGSIITILLMAGRERLFPTLLGIVVSAAVSMLTGCAVLKFFGKKGEEMKNEVIEEEKEMPEIHHIGFICDGGMGSSAMGAAILRRKLKESGILDMTVTAHAVDMIPEGVDLFVCQKSYLPILQREIGNTDNVYVVDSLVDSEGFTALVGQLKEAENKRGGADA